MLGLAAIRVRISLDISDDATAASEMPWLGPLRQSLFESDATSTGFVRKWLSTVPLETDLVQI